MDDVAGGMGTPRHQGLTLARSVRWASPVARSAVDSRTITRHCWVIDPAGWPGRWPGLLYSWERTTLGWRGFVAFIVAADGRPVLVQTWVDGGHLARA